MNKRFGLLGRRLGHSWSPRLHALLGDYEYRLYETEPEDLARFLRETELAGMNVTIPYKRDVIPFCASLSPSARRIGSVNTLIRTKDGWHGDNTDCDGFLAMAARCGAPIAGKKALVFGTGGASLAVRAGLEALGASPVIPISRQGPDSYENLDRHRDGQILVNATPLGMYPHAGVSPVRLTDFPRCEAVLDVVYNPLRTRLIMDAEALGLPHAGGLVMLAAQAVRASELFTGAPVPDGRTAELVRTLERELENIILIGMPGCGKSTLGALLARLTGRPFTDADAVIAERAGISIPQIFAREGEDGFRARETAALAELCQGSGAVIATGGGCVTRPENYPLLHQNGVIIWVQRSPDRLPTDGRPLSERDTPAALYEARKDKYARFADHTVDNDGPVRETAAAILEVLKR